MNKRQTATIRTLLVGSYSDILVRARKGVKGLRMQHVNTILLVGEYPDGVSCMDAAVLAKSSRSAIYQKLKRVISAGFIRKQNKRYYLTDSGATVYNSICTEFDASMKEIVRVLIEDARGKM